METQDAALLVSVLLAASGGAFALLLARVERLDERMRSAERQLAVLEPVQELVGFAGTKKLSVILAPRGR